MTLSLVGLSFLAALLVGPQSAAEEIRSVEIHFFWQTGCPYCARERLFLDELIAAEPRLRLHDYNVSDDPAAATLFKRAVALTGEGTPSVPLTIVGDRALVGFESDATTGAEIEQAIDACLARPCEDALAALSSGASDGTNARDDDPDVIPLKEKKLTNIRTT